MAKARHHHQYHIDHAAAKMVVSPGPRAGYLDRMMWASSPRHRLGLTRIVDRRACLGTFLLLPLESESESLPPCLAVMHSAGAQGNEICCNVLDDIHDGNTKFKESGGLQFQSN
jgi:hypothetical protein